jgi:hypothetical protein
MKKLLKTLFLMIVVGLVVAGVASYMSKKRLESKSDDEIREFLAKKLDGKVGDEQLATIQEAVIGGIRGKSAGSDSDPIDDADDDAAVDTATATDEADDDKDEDEDTVVSEDDDADESSEKASAE